MSISLDMPVGSERPVTNSCREMRWSPTTLRGVLSLSFSMCSCAAINTYGISNCWMRALENLRIVDMHLAYICNLEWKPRWRRAPWETSGLWNLTKRWFRSFIMSLNYYYPRHILAGLCLDLCLLWPPCVGDADIIFLPCGFFFLSFFLSSPNLSRRRLDVYHTSTQWCGLSANLRCRSETCCMRLAENTWRKKIAKNSPSGRHRTTLSDYIFTTKARIDNRKKIW